MVLLTITMILVYSLPHSSMVKQLSMMIVLIYILTKINGSFKYCPVVLEVKTEEPPYPLHRLYPSTAVLL